MSQSRSHGKQAPPSSDSQPAVARGGSHDSTSSSQHSQNIKVIEDDIDALIQEVDRLGREFIASTEEYNLSLSKAKRAHTDVRAQIFMNYLAELQEISMNSKPEDMKEQAYEELQKAAQNKLDEIKGRIDDQAKEIEAEGSEKAKRNAAAALRRTKANTIRGNDGEIKKVAGTPEGMQAIARCKGRLADAYKRVEIKLWNSYQQYLTKIGKLTEKQRKIKETLDKKKIIEVPEDRVEAARTVKKLRSQDLNDYEEGIKKSNRDDKRMKLLEK